MNNVNIIGRIGKEIELNYLPSGSAVASFSIAVNQDYKKQDGIKVEKTSWFDIVAFGKPAENINQFFGKGSNIGISGELEQQTWQDQKGGNRSRVVIKLQSFTFIDKRKQSNSHANYNQQQQPQQQMQQPTGQYTQNGEPIYQPPQNNQPSLDIDDEIPF